MAATSPRSIDALPPAIAYSIFRFAAGPHAPLSRWSPRDRLSRLQTLAQVSKTWNKLARDVASAITLRRFDVDADESVRLTCCRSGMLELRRRAVLRRAFAREFSMATHLFANMPSWLMTLEWRAVFCAMPHLETLDLSRVPRDDVRRLAVMLAGASRGCRNLRSLILPAVPQQPEIYYDSNEPVHQERPQDTSYLADAVVDALETWHAHGGELRELNVPFDSSVFGEAQSAATTAYVDKIATLCPHIERITGYEELYNRRQQWNCGEQWFIDESTWERFCSSCTQLKSFDWVVVPFATRFFEIFGRHAKSQLQQLTLSTPMNWNWPRYLESWGLPSDAIGYGATAQNVHEALRACPNLQTLMVPLYALGETPEPEPEELEMIFADIALSSGERPRRRERAIASREMMDQEIFGDAFCQALAQLCPQLVSLSMFRVVDTFGRDTRTIQSFTDVALRSLAKLAQLVALELPSVNVTGAGLFDLVTSFARGEQLRERDITVTVETFYRALEDFLRMLVGSDEQLFGTAQPVVMTVKNGALQVEDPQWAKAYLVMLRELVRRVQHRHSAMRLRVVLIGYKAECFAGIQQFCFYSANAELGEDDEYAEDDEDIERIDDVFIAVRDLD